MPVEFVNNSVKVKAKLNDLTIAWLYEAAGEIQGQAMQNSRVDMGQLKQSWTYNVDESDGVATVGSPLQNAIWEEFGTGAYAEGGKGRKGGWLVDGSKLSTKAKTKMRKMGDAYFTRGKYPQHTLQKAFDSKKTSIMKRLEEIMKGMNE